MITSVILMISMFQSGLANKYKMMDVAANFSSQLQTTDSSGGLDLNSVEIFSNQTLKCKSLRAFDSDNDGFLELFILADNVNSSIVVLDYVSGHYEVIQIIDLQVNITEFEVGFLDGDKYADIIYSPYMSWDVAFHLQNNITHRFPDKPNSTSSVGSFPIDDIELVFLHLPDRMDVVISYESTLTRMYYSDGTKLLEMYDGITINPGSEFVNTKVTRIGDFDKTFPYLNHPEIMMYVQSALSGHSYFVTVRKQILQDYLNDTFSELQLHGDPKQEDFIMIDANGDGRDDIIAVNDTGISLFYQQPGYKFNNISDQMILLPSLIQIEAGRFNDINSPPDILVQDGGALYIYYEAAFTTGPQMITLAPATINDMLVTDLDNNGFKDIIVLLRNTTHSTLVVFYHMAQAGIPPEKDPDFVAETIFSGALAGSSAAYVVLSPGVDISKFAPSSGIGDVTEPIRSGVGTDSSGLDIGTKSPGKWLKRKRYKMFASSAGMGAGISFIFLLLFYPIAMASSWLVILGSIIGPIGMIYGTYDFLYVGVYEHKGNIYDAYYKGKKKFFWDVFSWAKPILTAFCIYTTINMFAILTFFDWTLTGILTGVVFGALVGFLLLSVYVFKVKRVPVVAEEKKPATT